MEWIKKEFNRMKDIIKIEIENLEEDLIIMLSERNDDEIIEVVSMTDEYLNYFEEQLEKLKSKIQIYKANRLLKNQVDQINYIESVAITEPMIKRPIIPRYGRCGE